jgi:hypothetical protein
MSQEKVEIARRVHEAFNRGDLDGMVADFAATAIRGRGEVVELAP